MTTEEKPFDTSRIPVFYQNGSVKVGDKEYAPGEYPLGTDTTMTDVDTRILELIAGVELGAYRGANDERVEMSQADYKEAAQLIEALSAERDELERLAGDLGKAIEARDAASLRWALAVAGGQANRSMAEHQEIQDARTDTTRAKEMSDEALAALTAYQRKRKGE